jgi:aspartyl-tRNA(Asn)/glutamyl-tRNA(Gln) amidotransferase subunit A
MADASSIAGSVRSGLLSATAVTKAALEQVKKLDPELNCFTGVFEERALREAAEIDRMQQAGEQLPALAGVPYSVKNLFDVEGQVTLAGAAVNRDRPAARRDAVLVARMQKAGAILIGAVNMDEHAYGFTTENSHFGVTRNPLDTTRVAGGSSGGSAASVAAGMVSLSLGSDTNGSIRVPSSFCGIFGLKPTYGRLPRTDTFPFVHGLDHLGPFANSVDDLSLAYDALQGFDAGDPACVERPLDPVAGTLSMGGLKIAVLDGYFDQYATDDARRAVASAALALGATQKVVWADAEKARAAAFIITGSEGGAMHLEQLKHRYEEYEPLSRDRLIAGSLIPARWTLAAQKWRALCREQILNLFDEFDVLVCAATPFAAPCIGTQWVELSGKRLPARASIGVLTQPVSCIGLPVCAAPIYPKGPGLPIAVQLIAAPWQERDCLAAAKILENAGLTKKASLT